MIELAGLAAAAVAILVPILGKAAEKGAGVLAESAAKSLYELVKKKLTTPAAQEALLDAAEAPASADAQTVLRVQIEKALQRDEELVRLLSALVEQHERQGPGQTVRITGDDNQVIQVSGSRNTIVR